MRHRVTSSLIAAYLLLCIVFGGSSQIPWPGLGLQLFGVVLLGWAAITKAGDNDSLRPTAPYIILICGLVMVLAQLIPIPSSVGPNLPGRSAIAEAQRALDFATRAAPISLTPYLSVLTLFAVIPSIAIFATAERFNASSRALSVAIILGMIGAIILGAVQVAGGPDSRAYLYPVHSAGAVGFFANQNHMGTLLLVGIPLATVLIASANSTKRHAAGRYVVGAALFGLILVGIVLTGSRAAMTLAIPVTLASIALFPAFFRWRTPIVVIAVIGLVGAVALAIRNPVATAQDSGASMVDSRVEIWGVTAQAISDSFPVGTGLGSFQQVYHSYESLDEVTGTYVNHAHNDYLQITLELGFPGLLLLLVFLAWWGVSAARIWTSSLSTGLGRAATIASAAILGHSLVDFPLRTAAISAVLAACLAMMVQSLRPSLSRQRGELRSARHVRIG